MATPHVAGAAAILKQRHPEYTAAQLQGGAREHRRRRRLHALPGRHRRDRRGCRARRAVIASGSGDFGMLTWGEEPTLVERTVEYTNRSDAEVTVALDADAASTRRPARRRRGPGPAVGARGIRRVHDGCRHPHDPRGRDPHGHDDGRPGRRCRPARSCRARSSARSTASPSRAPRSARSPSRSATTSTITATGLRRRPDADVRLDLWDAANEWHEPVPSTARPRCACPKGNYSVMSYMELDRTPDTHRDRARRRPRTSRSTAGHVGRTRRPHREADHARCRRAKVSRPWCSRVDFTADGFGGGADHARSGPTRCGRSR